MSPRSEHYLMTVRDGNGNFAFRSEMLAGRLWGYPFGVTSQIPENLAVTGSSESEIYLADFADVVIGEASTLVLDVSDTAAYHDGSNVVASFSLDQTVIRAIERHDFGMRHDASVAVLTDVDWGA
jgi:HK97 family phage major capsid protein